MSPELAFDWLPATEPVSRIFVPDLLELTGLDLAQTVLETWWSHPQVSVKTLLVATGRKADVMDLVRVIRPAGWGIACPYDARLLRWDKWPVPPATSMEGRVASLCRAIKKTEPAQLTEE